MIGKPTKRDLLAPIGRSAAARVYRVCPDDLRPQFVVVVRIARNIRHMRAERLRLGFSDLGPLCEGSVSSINAKPHCSALYPRGVVAHMFLNVASLRARPSELVAHECGHAAMAWARFRRANLSIMGSSMWPSRKAHGEELLCYAIGELVRGVNCAMYAAGVFP